MILEPLQNLKEQVIKYGDSKRSNSLDCTVMNNAQFIIVLGEWKGFPYIFCSILPSRKGRNQEVCGAGKIELGTLGPDQLKQTVSICFVRGLVLSAGGTETKQDRACLPRIYHLISQSGCPSEISNTTGLKWNLLSFG